MRPAIVLMVSVLVLGGPIPAKAQQRGPICNTSAYLETGARLSVLATPSANGRLLRIRSQGSPVAEITGQSGGWFRVSRITDYEGGTELFRGTGWMRIPALGTSIANYDPWLYAQPQPRSRRLVRLVPDESRVRLLGCRRDWLQVRFRSRIGWLSRGGQCSNPLTTCP